MRKIEAATPFLDNCGLANPTKLHENINKGILKFKKFCKIMKTFRISGK